MSNPKMIFLPAEMQKVLFDDEIPGEFTSSPKLRTLAVSGDTMEPTLRRGDFVMVVPETRYRYEGLYVVEDNGFPTIYRVQPWSGRNELRMAMDHTALRDKPQIVTKDWFEEHILGFVVAHIQVTDPAALRAAVAA